MLDVGRHGEEEIPGDFTRHGHGQPKTQKWILHEDWIKYGNETEVAVERIGPRWLLLKQ